MKQRYLTILFSILMTILCVVITPVKADEQINNTKDVSSLEKLKPHIDFTYLGITPSNPMVGQEFTVRYKLTPQPFQHNISKPKEIVLVLDGSGSMSGTKLENLKNAAEEFITKMREVDNLKVAIVVFSSNGTINPISVNGTKSLKSVDSSQHSVPNYTSFTDEYFLDIQDPRLITMIDNIKAQGGTNTGDGLRKAEYLLGQKGDSTANKTIILMSDGLPTFYSGSSQSEKNYYTEFKDDSVGNFKTDRKGKVTYYSPYLKGTGTDSNESNVTTSTEYAKKIGNIIRSNNYNIFSIGYELGDSNSIANQKLKEIHTSMGGIVTGDNNTFFASDEGAIDTVFTRIAEQLIKSYSFNDAQLNLELPDSVTLLEETAVVNGIKIDPIVYELGENNWYHAPEQFIEFKIKVDAVGDIKIFNPDTRLTYTDISGNKQSIPIESPTITIAPFDVDSSNKLQLDFQSLSNGYLIGDTAIARVTAIRPNVNNIKFNRLNFTVNSIPSNLQLVGEDVTLNFGTVTQTASLDYKFIINDDSNITYENLKQYEVDGSYNYEIKQGDSSKTESGSGSTIINVKRGQIRVKVIDEAEANISQLSTISIKGSNYQGIYQDGYIIFDTIPSGNYELLLEQLPEGLQISEENRNAKVMINFDRNIGEYIFQVEGVYEEEHPSVSPIVKDSISILEIQPADSFTLTTNSDGSKIRTGKEDGTIKVNNNEYKVSITHTSMPEFIGKAEKIDGKYDIVVLGRYVDPSITNSNDELNQYRYRDYYYDRGDNNEENDITVRKANELIEFMNKNQLVYIDSNIINNTTNSNSDYMKTNLYKIFSTDQNRSQKNLKTNFTTSKESGANIVTLQQVIKDYISLDPKEKGFTISLIDPVPNDITTDDINAVDGKAENRNRYLDLTVRNADNSKENVTLNLYLDLNGDGLYSEDEIAVSRDHLALPLENYKLDFSIHPDFIGLLEWKLEVIREDTNQTKTYLTGSNFFHRLTEEKKKINVLQITAQGIYDEVDGEGNTDEDKNYQVLNLKSNDDFTNLLSAVELKDYDITIDIIYYEQYIKYLNSSDDELDESKLKFKYLNGYYDMVICGFQDVYGRNAFGGDNNDKDKSKYSDSLKFVDSLIEFVRTGQGLMLTHDTIEKNSTPIMFNTFRVFSGQSRYPTISDGEIVNDFNGDKINYDQNTKGTNTNGLTIWGLMGDSEGATNSMSTGVYQTNNALITSYPYVLTDEEEEGLLRIRRTHGQYYQLNLEDEEVIPWYSFSPNNKGENGGRRPQFNTWINSVNPYDVRNNYYTYSRGNITFSGTGEQRREYIHYPKSELKLFVNTIIKAERGANHRPTVEVQNIENEQQISLSQNKIEFNVIPRDIDLDLMDVTIEVSACKDNKCSVVGTPIIYKNQKDNESFQVTLDQVLLSQVSTDTNQLKIKVYAVDEHEAKSEEVIKTLEIVDLDLLTVSLSPQDGNTGFLVGDTIDLVANFSKSENYNSKYTSLNYNLSLIPSSLQLIGESNRNLGELTNQFAETIYKLVIKENSAFSPSNTISLKVEGKSSYCINSCTTTITGDQSLTLGIKKGQIRIKLISEQFSEQLLQTKLTVQGKDNNKEWTVKPNSAGEFVVDNVPTGKYSLEVELPDGLKNLEVIQQSGNENKNVDLKKGLQFEINYEKNIYEGNFIFIEPQTDINHGLYGGLDESNNQFKIIPSEVTQSGEDLRKEFVGGSTVNFAGIFTYKSSLQSVQLLVDKAFNISENNVKAYKILTTNSGVKLEEIQNVEVYSARQQSNDLIMFNFVNKIPINTPVLIHYSVKVPDINNGIYTNTLRVGTKEKSTSIKSIKQINEDKTENLPYLF
ncbi:DUF5057 domain-containing protein [Turicibacter sp. TJ11]|uniref:DUF5057 domain-containing protein n=1 Tax=Turicibacter sp. TJ11 TaxID=2806443 RepID=UPI001F4721F3|nr:DUF5057 domain-containing protein [Turicibacter sp. TJ11]